MHCGPIRYQDNPRKQAENRPFDHYIVPRFTSLRVPLDVDEQEVSIQQYYTEIMENDFRNQQIIDDVLKNYQQGRNCIVLSLRTAHVDSLAKRLKEKAPDSEYFGSNNIMNWVNHGAVGVVTAATAGSYLIEERVRVAFQQNRSGV